jgi:hypothetical protein
MDERRHSPRNRVLKSGVIEFGGGVISCIVRNLSPAGAALDVESPLGIPEHFHLIVESDHLGRRCHVKWRKEKRIGVVFE